MTDGLYRIGIVGATSLVGKELSDELQNSLLATADFILLDDEEVSGQVTSVGDEAAFIQRIEATTFQGMDFVFFAGERAATRKHWEVARKSGASIIDLTNELEREADAPVRSPSVSDALKLKGEAKVEARVNLSTPALVAAHPAAVMLGLVAARLQVAMEVKSFAAVVVEPASQQGREAMDEMHQQTVNLLSFQTLPREQYDAQVAFNVLPTLGEAAKVKLDEAAARIQKHYGLIGEGRLPRLELELLQAPVFHGYTASVLVELAEDKTVEAVEKALVGEGVDVIAEGSEPPSNLSAAGQEDVMVRVRGTGAANRFWIWMAADNLKLNALNAIACANELRRLRPRGKVQ